MGLWPTHAVPNALIFIRHRPNFSLTDLKFTMLENPNDRGENQIGQRIGSRIWPVGELIKAVAGVLEARFNPVAVEGEISGFSRAASGHCYFSLKDAHGQVRCAMFRRAASMLDFSPRDGQSVELRGRVGVFEPRGELQLVVESLRQAGQGSLFDQFLKLKAKLESEGLFDAAHKRGLPLMPKAIGVVTSLSAAALHDVVSALQRRTPHIPVVIYPSAVQGALAATELCQALARSFQRDEVDVLLLVRGGGSMEDLWSFNNEQLARLIYASPIPMISGIGHETDFTIADFCADLRAPTPTAAAELAAQSITVSEAALSLLATRAQRGVIRQLQSTGQRFDKAVDRFAQPSHFLSRQQAQLDGRAQNLQHASKVALLRASATLEDAGRRLPMHVSKALQKKRREFNDARLRLDLLNPHLVLQRGYALLTDSTGRPVTSVKHLRTGQRVQATLMDGEVDFTVAAPRLI